MHEFKGFDDREPGAKVLRIAKFLAIWIFMNERWAGDGHDKLFASSKWLGAWVVPSNRMGKIRRYVLTL